jgi:hypothetical protein
MKCAKCKNIEVTKEQWFCAECRQIVEENKEQDYDPNCGVF